MSFSCSNTLLLINDFLFNKLVTLNSLNLVKVFVNILIKANDNKLQILFFLKLSHESKYKYVIALWSWFNAKLINFFVIIINQLNFKINEILTNT